MTALLIENLTLLASTQNGIKKLRELILELAVRGKLVPQDPNDEPASELLKQITVEKTRLVAEGKIKKQKSLAEISDEEKPFELPAGWLWTRLGEICLTQTGTTPSKSQPELFGSDVPFIKPGDIYSNQVDYNGEGLSSLGAFKNGRTAEAGSLLMVCIGTIGKCNLIEQVCSFNQQINSATLYRGLPQYLRITARSKYFQAKAWSESSSTTIAILNKGKWEAIPLPLPGIAEQHRIVSKVDELMALCDRLEAQQADSESAHAQLVQALLDSLVRASDANELAANWQRLSEHFHTLFTTEPSIDALKQTLLQLAVMGKLVPQDPNDEPASELLKQITVEKTRLVAEGKIKKQKSLTEISDEEKPFELPAGWLWTRLGEICLTQTGTTPSKSQPELFGSDVPFIKPGDIYSDQVDYNGEGLSSLGASQNGRIAQAGSLLMVCIGTIGKCNLIEQACSFNQQINSATLYIGLPQYLRIAARSKYFQAKAWSESSSTTIAILNKGKWEAIPLPLPSIAEQHRIISKVDQLMTLCEQLKSRLSQARQLNEQMVTTLVEQAVV